MLKNIRIGIKQSRNYLLCRYFFGTYITALYYDSNYYVKMIFWPLKQILLLKKLMIFYLKHSKNMNCSANLETTKAILLWLGSLQLQKRWNLYFLIPLTLSLELYWNQLSFSSTEVRIFQAFFNAIFSQHMMCIA